MNSFDTETFDDALERLEGIIKSLDNEDVPLDEGFFLCQEGRALLRYCNHKLKCADRYFNLYLERVKSTNAKQDD